jgi:hypothetical protein
LSPDTSTNLLGSFGSASGFDFLLAAEVAAGVATGVAAGVAAGVATGVTAAGVIVGGNVFFAAFGGGILPVFGEITGSFFFAVACAVACAVAAITISF